jgi:1-acyl-sn-glycerol-3-phosphate acyltransferase
MKKLRVRAAGAGKIYQWVGKMGMKLVGWKVEGSKPPVAKCVVIAAPHTSSWDFLYMMGAAFTLGVRISWLGKVSLFKGVRGWFARRLGGIPVDRRGSHNLVSQVAAVFRQRDHLMLVVPAEGTRSKTDHWKTGFYYIALESKVPIVFAFVDYKRKMVGICPELLVPSGDIYADFEIIRAFYSDKTAKHPENFSDIRVKPSDDKLEVTETE